MKIYNRKYVITVKVDKIYDSNIILPHEGNCVQWVMEEMEIKITSDKL